MKKSLLALAVLGAFASAASAQSTSSVTLFGVLDVNARYVNNDGVKQYQMGSDGINSSRLGFRGVEDLGGGLSAGFWLEGALTPQNGTTTGQTWRRRSTVSLLGGWGEARFGRDYTATFWNSTIFDPFGTNGVGGAGNLIFLTGACATAAFPSSCLDLPAGAGYGTAVRADNIFAYFLPSGIAGGLYGQVQIAPGQNSPGNRYLGGRIGYAAGPFNVAGAWGRTQVTIAGVGPLPADQSGTNWNLGGSWDFKFMQLSGYYGNIDIANASQSNWYLGVSAPFGAWTARATYGAMDRSGTNPFNNASIDSQKATQWAIGGQYDLSTRTAMYATWAGINNKGGTAFIVGRLNNIANGGAVPNGNSQGGELGIRHSF